jgi:hypothetical protein
MLWGLEMIQKGMLSQRPRRPPMVGRWLRIGKRGHGKQ